ncbi:hypothetical protein ACLMJK_001820 [Lecanora helva]
MSSSEESSVSQIIPMQTEYENEDMDAASNYLPTVESSSSSSSQEAPPSRGRSRKRQNYEESLPSYSRSKRLKTSYNDNYRKLFNNTLSDIISEEILLDTSLASSQIGISVWSPEEKERLFRSLVSRGRHDVKAIAADVDTKSQPEVMIFLQKLQKVASEEQIYVPDRKSLPKIRDIDAAFEISEDCCASLDRVAEALSSLQEREEEKAERKKHGRFSHLTDSIAKMVHQRLGAGEQGEIEVAKMLPAAVLLNLKTFLDLSRRLFMNSSVMENNWRSYVERLRRPSILYTAFSDFHNLVLSVTKRLVQTSLFCAMSRRRAAEASKHHKSGRHVKRDDVLAAFDILGMQKNSMMTWARVARKCKLQVYDNVRHRQISGRRYCYDEVEEILSSRQPRSRSRSRSRLAHPPSIAASPRSDTGSGGDIKHSSPAPSSVEDNDPQTDSSNGDLPTTDIELSYEEEVYENAHDSYTEALDQRAGQAEERRLWELLGEDPVAMMGNKGVQVPKAPATELKSKDDLDDWKDWVDYAAEWETFEAPISTLSFKENRRKGILRESVMLSDDLDEDASSGGLSADDQSNSNVSVQDDLPSEPWSATSQDSVGTDSNDDEDELSAPSSNQALQDTGD